MININDYEMMKVSSFQDFRFSAETGFKAQFHVKTSSLETKFSSHHDNQSSASVTSALKMCLTEKMVTMVTTVTMLFSGQIIQIR